MKQENKKKPRKRERERERKRPNVQTPETYKSEQIILFQQLQHVVFSHFIYFCFLPRRPRTKISRRLSEAFFHAKPLYIIY